jgi:conjugative transfer signal peptidase TraF
MTLVTMLGGTTLMLATLGQKPIPVLLWNASESVPIGLYRVLPLDELDVADLVIAFPPDPVAELLAERGYLPRGIPLMKRIVALAGQTVCRSELAIRVDGIPLGAARERDSRGHPLPVWHGCQTVGEDQVFLMNADEPDSFDGRYFGPISVTAIVGRAVPLWTFERD